MPEQDCFDMMRVIASAWMPEDKALVFDARRERMGILDLKTGQLASPGPLTIDEIKYLHVHESVLEEWKRKMTENGASQE